MKRLALSITIAASMFSVSPEHNAGGGSGGRGANPAPPPLKFPVSGARERRTIRAIAGVG